jgi:hypothetical protein
MSDKGHIEPPLDLHGFRVRAAQIVQARQEARREYQECAIAGAEAEHEYRKRKAIRMAVHRNDGKGVTEAEIYAEGDVAEFRRERDTQQYLAKAAMLRWEELKDNRAMLRRESELSEGIEFTGTAA